MSFHNYEPLGSIHQNSLDAQHEPTCIMHMQCRLQGPPMIVTSPLTHKKGDMFCTFDRATARTGTCIFQIWLHSFFPQSWTLNLRRRISAKCMQGDIIAMWPCQLGYIYNREQLKGQASGKIRHVFAVLFFPAWRGSQETVQQSSEVEFDLQPVINRLEQTLPLSVLIGVEVYAFW